MFYTSDHDTGSFSLNNFLHLGPNLYPEIFNVLLRFRFNPIHFTTDINQAFLQIVIDEVDRGVTRFLLSEELFDLTKLIINLTKLTKLYEKLNTQKFKGFRGYDLESVATPSYWLRQSNTI